ncbi:extracellular solute-binding protein [Occultella kanbiaonis]|uniref:extracellular solute-binding protein n=1 Tax=Occultella kanbiaonis TaxID=2675754 RepID=UPI0012B6E457|nr:extracellular solute-binding protein [Occultella kanbiaonis]
MSRSLKFLEADRRTVLKGGVAAAVAALGGGVLASCSSEGSPSGGGGGGGGGGATVELPTYQRFEGATADFPAAAEGMNEGFRAYPSDPQRVISDALGDGEVISFMTNIPGAIPPTRDANSFWQAVEERIGSPLEISMSSNDEYKDKFATRIAGGDIPDILNIPKDVAQLPDLLEATCLDLTEYLSGDAVLDYPFLANLPSQSWPDTRFNGKIFAVPVPRGMSRTSAPIFRQDLTEAAGISEANPGSFDEFMDLCAEMTAPGANRWAWASMPSQYIQQMWGTPYLWAEDGGAFTHMYETDEMLGAIEDMIAVWAAGVVNPDAYTATGGAKKQWLAAGTATFIHDSFVAWNQFYTDNPTITEMQLNMLDVPGRDGGQGSPWMGAANNNITAFNAETTHDPEVLLAIANWMAAPFGTEEYLFRKFGVEGEHYELSGTDPVPTPLGSSEVGIGLQYISDAPMALYLPGRPDVPETQAAVQATMVGRLVDDASYGLYSETKSRMNAQLESAVNDAMNQVVQGNAGIETFTDAVETWRVNGGDAIRGELEEAYAAEHG